MKMSMLEMVMLATGMTMIGYYCLKNNPDMMCKAKKVVRDTSKKIYKTLDEKED